MCECACLLFVIIEEKIVFDLQHFVKSGYSFARLVSARNQELTPILLIRLPLLLLGVADPHNVCSWNNTTRVSVQLSQAPHMPRNWPCNALRLRKLPMCPISWRTPVASVCPG